MALQLALQGGPATSGSTLGNTTNVSPVINANFGEIGIALIGLAVLIILIMFLHRK